MTVSVNSGEVQCSSLIHWADDGPSDISNAALLCRAHHTLVHTYRYAGHVVRADDDGSSKSGGGGGRPRVVWDLTIGSYDDALTQFRHRQRDRALACSLPATA